VARKIATIKVSIFDKEVTDLIKKMKHKSVNMKPLYTWMYGKVDFNVKQNFRLQSAPADILSFQTPTNTRVKWKPHSQLVSASRGPGSSLLQDTGMLRASMGTVRVITGRGMTYGTHHGTARAHHFGATIKPKKAKKLAIPMPGVKGGPRDYTNTFIVRNIIYEDISALSVGSSFGSLNAVPLFILKNSVKIPARPMITLTKDTIDSFNTMTYNHLIGKTFLK
jgi:phage gpG-like protein